jgi:glycoprotein endo-alpha-1,2-mannosidase
VAVISAGSVVPAVAGLEPTNTAFQFALEQGDRRYSQVPHEVLAFYYPWYGTAERQGRWLHWDRVDVQGHDIASSRHYPVKGAYDSHDPAIVSWHIATAKRSGISGFIVSWWGINSFEDQAVPLLLSSAATNDFKISVYWEDAPGHGRAQIDNAVRELSYLVKTYGANPAFLKANGKPVIFAYGRVMGQVPLDSWPQIISETRAAAGDFLLIADGYQESYARLFDGVHTYNIAAEVAAQKPATLRDAIARDFAGDVRVARNNGRISCLTIIPGYDDTKIRKPGLKAERRDGFTYRVLWEEAVKAHPDWVLITSWNEWHEGSEIEPSLEEGQRYLEITAAYAPQFLQSDPVQAPLAPGIDADRLARLSAFYGGRTVGVLPGGAGSALVFWLHRLGASVRELDWADLPDGARFGAEIFPLVIYAGGEHYTGTVMSRNDVQQALIRYLGQGGFLLCLPREPWPFYYDDSRGGRTSPITQAIGLPVASMPDQMQVEGLTFQVDTQQLRGLTVDAPFPSGGDLRWRPAVPALAAGGDNYLSLARLHDAQGRFYGDSVACIEHRVPPLGPGKSLYVWMRMPDAFEPDAFYVSLLEFISTKLNASSSR